MTTDCGLVRFDDRTLILNAALPDRSTGVSSGQGSGPGLRRAPR